MLEYLLLAVAPGVFWLWFFWRKDTYEREPAGYLVKTFLLGIAAVLPVLPVEYLFTVNLVVLNMMVVGIIEETAKFMAVYLYMYRKKEFNEVMDGIIYSAAASLGFASLENLFYIIVYGPSVIVGRAVLSTLGHVLFASFWGYSLGMKKMTGKSSILGGLIVAAVAHGIYNTIVMASYWYVSFLVVPLMVILYKSMSRKIRKSLEMSPFKSFNGLDLVKCPRCGSRLPKNVQFCPECGERVNKIPFASRCSRCGIDLPPGSRFCPECGERVNR